MVLADAGDGSSATFRHGLDARGLRRVVGIAQTQKVYAADVQLTSPTGRAQVRAGPGAARRRGDPGRSRLAAQLIASAYWTSSRPTE